MLRVSAGGSYPASNFRITQLPFQFVALAARSHQQMLHEHGTACTRGQKCGIHSNVADIAAWQVELGQLLRIESQRGSLAGKHALPYPAAQRRIGKRKRD